MSSIFDQYPYSNTHELNLDWLLGVAKQMVDNLATIESISAEVAEVERLAGEAAASAEQAAQSAATFSTDPTLSISGKAADAKATGDTTINGKAFRTNPVLNAGDVGAAPATEDVSNPGCYYRTVNGVQEWVNPPLVLWEEYRTVERFNGSPVYVKLIDCQALPATSYKTVAHLIPDINRCIDATLVASNQRAALTTFSYISYINFGPTNVELATNSDVSSTTAYALLSYTK